MGLIFLKNISANKGKCKQPHKYVQYLLESAITRIKRQECLIQRALSANVKAALIEVNMKQLPVMQIR